MQGCGWNDMNTCKTCKFWATQLFNVTAAPMRECKCRKLMERYEPDGGSLIIEPDAAVAWGYENPDLLTGPDFGCIHHAPRVDTF